MPNDIDTLLGQYWTGGDWGDAGDVPDRRAHDLLPHAMLSPPVMSPEDVALYRGAAYGTPYETWIDSPARATAYQWALRSPAAAFGLRGANITELPEEERANLLGRAYNNNVEVTPDRDNLFTSPGVPLTHEIVHNGHDTTRMLRILNEQPFTRDGWMHALRAILAAPATSSPFWRAHGSHRMMAQEEAAIGDASRTRLADDKYYRDSDPEAVAGVQATNEAIDWLNRVRGDYSRMGPR